MSTTSIKEKIIKAIDKDFYPRWIRYNETLLSLLSKEVRWVDCGCGDNIFVKEFGNKVRKAIGIDLLPPKENTENFVQCDLSSLPFEDNSYDVASLRFVVEHLPNPDENLKDLHRVLSPGGKMIFITTNIWNPIIALARLLPYNIKHSLITKIFKVDDDDVFPTHHKLNTPAGVSSGVRGFKPVSIEYISDLNTRNTIFFAISIMLHILTKPRFLNKFRSNILCVYKVVK